MYGAHSCCLTAKNRRLNRNAIRLNRKLREPFRETGAVFFLISITFAYDETEYLWLIMIDDGPGDSVKQ